MHQQQRLATKPEPELGGQICAERDALARRVAELTQRLDAETIATRAAAEGLAAAEQTHAEVASRLEARGAESEAKRALEYLFWVGDLTSAGRRGFQRLYDVPERVLPAGILGQASPARAEAQVDLLRHAARASGVATETDLRDYYRLPASDTKARLAELVEAGDLQPVTVEGWKQPGYLCKGERTGDVEACALLSPFDSLIWNRPRTERLFGFHYRLAFYTPAHARSHGYYVMPFLMDGRLVARIDVKADRKAGALLVLAGHAEPGEDEARIADSLDPVLASLAGWLDLPQVRITARTRLGLALRRSSSRKAGAGIAAT